MQASLVRWELIWTAVEAGSVGLALWLLLSTQLTTLATLGLWGVCIVSVIVRTTHYLAVR